MDLDRRHPDWPEDILDAVGQMAAIYVSAASQHVLALTDLLSAGRMALSPWTVVRAQLEAVGRVGWLLEPASADGSPVTPQARVARAHMDGLAGLHRRCYSISRARLGSAAEREAKKGQEELTTKVERLFPDAKVEWERPRDERKWKVGGEHYLGLGAAIAVFNRITMPENRGSYDALSDFSHPTPSVLWQLTRTRPVDDHVTYDWVVDEELIAWLARASAFYLYGASSLLAGYFELDDTELEKWADNIEAVVAGT